MVTSWSRVLLDVPSVLYPNPMIPGAVTAVSDSEDLTAIQLIPPSPF